MCTKDCKRNLSSLEVATGGGDTEAPSQSVEEDDISLLGQGDFSQEKLAIEMTESPLAERANGLKHSSLKQDHIKFDQYVSDDADSKAEALLQLERVIQAVEYLTHKLKRISASWEVATAAGRSFENEEDQLEETNYDDDMVLSAAQKLVLEGDRGQYDTEICGVNSSMEKLMRTCQNHDAFLVSKSNAPQLDVEVGHAVQEATGRASDFSKEILEMKEAIELVTPGQDKPVEMVARKDVPSWLCKASLEGSAKKLQVMKKELDTDLTGHPKVHLCQLVAIIRALKKEMDAVEAVVSNHSLGPQWEIVKEESSLQSLLSTLKLKLDVFIKEHIELKEMRAETATILEGKCNIDAFLVENAKAGVPWERNAEAGCKVEQEITKAKVMRSNTCRIALDEVEKKPRNIVEDAEVGLSRTVDDVATSSKGTDTPCVSTSGVEFVSSGGIEEGSKKSSVRGSAASISQVEVEPNYSSFPEFSIRDYVFGARRNDINMNWPFSRRSLQHCLNNGVKNLLPPFQTFDSLRNGSTNQFLADTRSNMDEKPLSLDNHPISCSFNRESDYQPEVHCSDSDSFRSGDQDIASKTSTHSQSEMESVSTSKIPVLKESNRFGSSAPIPICKSKRSSTLSSKKKRKLAVKSSANIGSGAAEDITATSAVTNEAVASKTCPVCGNFSSSSNTKLNAHIDQCLSAGSPSGWMENSTKCVKMRIKPRKMRLIADIYTTASCCTLEELDRRNGRISAADSDLGPPVPKVSKSTDERGFLGHLKKNCCDTAVYVDSRGRKIRILSRFVDASSECRGAKELKPKKMLKKGNRGIFFCSNKKRHLAKGLKYSHSCIQTKKFSSLRASITKGCTGDKASRAVEEKYMEKGLVQPFKPQEHDKVADSETVKHRWFSVRTVFSKNRLCKGKRGRPKCKLRSTKELLADSRQSCSLSNSFGNHDENPSPGSAKAHVSSMQSSTKRDISPGEVLVDQNNFLSNRRSNIASSTLLRGSVHSSGESYLESSKLDTVIGSLAEPSDFTEICSSSSGKDNDIHPDVAEHSGKSFHASRMLPKIHACPEASRLSVSDKTMPLSSQSSFAAFSRIPSYGSAIEKPNGISLDEDTVAWCDEMGRELDLIQVDVEHHSDTSGKIISHYSSEKFGRKEGVGGLTESSDPDIHKLVKISDTRSNILESSECFFQTEALVHLNQPCLGDIQNMFYASEAGVGRMGHENEDAKSENGISVPLFESIPIPGPPGSYLPSFRDNCVEDLQWNNSSLTTSWVRSSQETPGVVDGYFSDSPISAASSVYLSTITNAVRTTPKPDASRGHPHIFPPNICSRSMGEAAETRTESVFSPSSVASVGAEKVTLDIDNLKVVVTHQERESPSSRGDDDQKQCSYSTNEEIAWDASLGIKKLQLAREKAVCVVEEPTSNRHVGPSSCGLGNNMKTGTGVFSRNHCSTLVPEYLSCSTAKFLGGDSGTAVLSSPPPTPPVLRLMGKNLMVINKDEDATTRPQPAPDSQGIECPSFSVVPHGIYGSPCNVMPLGCDVVGPNILPVQQHLNFKLSDSSPQCVPVQEHVKFWLSNSFHSSMNVGMPPCNMNIPAVEARGTTQYR